MDQELAALLEKARETVLTQEQMEEQRVHIAAANGQLADDRISVDTLKATRTIMRGAVPQSH